MEKPYTVIRDWRAIRQSLFVPGSKKFWRLKNDTHRLMFLNLVVAADDEGRLEGEPDDIKAVAPRSNWTIAEIQDGLEDLESVGLIVRYDRYIQIANFVEMQSWHGLTNRSSKIPAPINGNSTSLVSAQTNPVSTPFNGVPTSTGNNTIPSHPKKEESEEETKSAWREFHKVWKRITRCVPKPTDANLEFFHTDCKQYGLARLLAAVKPWAAAQNKSYISGNKGAEWKFLKDGVHDYVDSEQDEDKEEPFPEL